MSKHEDGHSPERDDIVKALAAFAGILSIGGVAYGAKKVHDHLAADVEGYRETLSLFDVEKLNPVIKQAMLFMAAGAVVLENHIEGRQLKDEALQWQEHITTSIIGQAWGHLTLRQTDENLLIPLKRHGRGGILYRLSPALKWGGQPDQAAELPELHNMIDEYKQFRQLD